MCIQKKFILSIEAWGPKALSKGIYMHQIEIAEGFEFGLIQQFGYGVLVF